MTAPRQAAEPLTDIEYKLLLVSYTHSRPKDGTLNKGKIISTLFAAAGPVGNNPASLPQLLEGFQVESIAELEAQVNDFALGPKRDLLINLKHTRTSVLNALPPDFPAGSRDECDAQVKPVLGALARKVQALQEQAKQAAEAAEAAAKLTPDAPVEAPKKAAIVRAMIWQPPIKAAQVAKLGGRDSKDLRLVETFNGDMVLGAGALMFRLRVEGNALQLQHYEMYGEHREGEDTTLPLGKRFVIGRGVKADHRRPDQDVDPGSRGLSRMHVAVTVKKDPTSGRLSFQLEDLGSTNGTPVWWNSPSLDTPTTMTCQEKLQKSIGLTHIDEAFAGEAWLAAGAMWFRLLVVEGGLELSHRASDQEGDTEADSKTLHSLGAEINIGRDPNSEHVVPKDHAGGAGLSRKHLTVRVLPRAGVLRLQVEDHSSYGTTVCWNKPD